jgi:hypothetical protein
MPWTMIAVPDHPRDCRAHKARGSSARQKWRKSALPSRLTRPTTNGAGPAENWLTD